MTTKPTQPAQTRDTKLVLATETVRQLRVRTGVQAGGDARQVRTYYCAK